MTRHSDLAIRHTWQCASWLLDYPDAIDDVVHAALAETVNSLPDDLGVPLARFLAYRAVTDLAALEAGYVATFDSRRRCSLSLTYFTAGTPAIAAWPSCGSSRPVARPESVSVDVSCPTTSPCCWSSAPRWTFPPPNGCWATTAPSWSLSCSP